MLTDTEVPSLAEPLDVCDVLLGQPYMWKRHAIYESHPCSVIITLGKRLYRIVEVAPTASISLILAKQCTKVITQTRKFLLLMICSQGEKKVVATSMASTRDFATQ